MNIPGSGSAAGAGPAPHPQDDLWHSSRPRVLCISNAAREEPDRNPGFGEYSGKKTGFSSASPRPRRVPGWELRWVLPTRHGPKGAQQILKEYFGVPGGVGWGGMRGWWQRAQPPLQQRCVRGAGGQWGPPRMGQELLLPPSPPQMAAQPLLGSLRVWLPWGRRGGRGGSFLVITPRPSQPGSWREPGGTQLKLSMVLP